MAESSDGNPILVACLGDSITAGSQVDGATESYPARLQQLLGDRFLVKNFGVGGATFWHGGKPNGFEQLPACVAFAPHIVIVGFGINDTRLRDVDYWDHFPEFVPDATRMLNTLLAIPTHPRIILCQPITNFADLPGMDPARMESVAERLPRLVLVREALRGIAAAYAGRGITLADLHAVTQARPDVYTLDGVHLHASGYRLLAQTLHPHVAALAEGASFSTM